MECLVYDKGRVHLARLIKQDLVGGKPPRLLPYKFCLGVKISLRYANFGSSPSIWSTDQENNQLIFIIKASIAPHSLGPNSLEMKVVCLGDLPICISTSLSMIGNAFSLRFFYTWELFIFAL